MVLCLLALDDPLLKWLTSANADAPFVALGFLGFFALYFGKQRARAVVLAAACLALAFLFKPQGFVLSVAGFVFLLVFERDQLWRYHAGERVRLSIDRYSEILEIEVQLGGAAEN